MNEPVASQHKPKPKPKKRSLRNFLLQPGLQTVLGLYTILLSTLFALSLGIIIYWNFADLFQSVLLLTDAQDEVKEILRDYWISVELYVFLAIAVYMVSVVSVTVWYTHRLVGPTIAFHKHIMALVNKRYDIRIVLRRNDAFGEVAEALNLLSSTLEKEQNQTGKKGRSPSDLTG